MDPPSRAGRPPGSTTILAENVSCPRPEIDCPTALGRQTDPAESRCGSARLAWQSSAVFQFAFEPLRRHRPVDLVFGKLLPVFDRAGRRERIRSEEHTSELQSPCNLVCRLLLEKKKKKN